MPLKKNIIAVANQKGGVGKTSTAVNLSAALGATGRRILVIDADPQGNSSTGLGIDTLDRDKDFYRLLSGEASKAGAVRESVAANVEIIPASADLSAVEIELATEDRPQFRFREVIGKVAGGYDYVFIDCPPALGLITVNALTAAGSVLVPLQCEYYALEGMSQLIDTIDSVRHGLNDELSIKGVVLTMFDSRNKLSGMVANDVRKHMGDLVYETMIPRNVRISEAPSYGLPVLLYDPECKGSKAYADLAEEVDKQEG